MQLGIVLAPYGQVPNAFPYEIGYAFGGDGTYLGPPDAQYLTKGEYGYYHDTSLGGARKKPGLLKRLLGLGNPDNIPYNTELTDFDLGTIYGYTPVKRGWITTKEGYVTGPWVPPNGWRSNGAYGPATWPLDSQALSGLRDASVLPSVPIDSERAVTAQEVIDIMNAQNDRIFTLTVISTVIGATAYLLMAFRQARALKHGV